jgi:serine/threonine protein kinase
MEPSVTGPLEPFRLDGAELAGYLVHSLIGRGGMAYVYRAQDRRLGRTVAIKVLAPELAQNEDFRRRFLRESRLAASIDHPNIIPIYDAGEAGGHLYIAMRYVEGSDLKALLTAVGRLDPPRAVHIFSQVAAALDTAHASGLVHRDVKPANILIAPAAGSKGREHVYLSDFGLTKRSSSVSGATAAGAVIGTMDYVAPEQIAGKPVDPRTDVYALGCVVYQSLTGTVPFVRDDEAALLWAHLVESPPPVSRLRPDLPPTVQAVLAKAMAKAADDRYPTCGEFIAALAAELDAQEALAQARAEQPSGPHSGIAVPAPAPPTDEDVAGSRPSHPRPVAPAPAPAVPRRPRPRRTAIAVLAGFVAVAVAVAGFLLLRGGGSAYVQSTANGLVPFTFSHPADWRRAGGGTNVVFSPHAEEILPLFQQPGEARNWSATRRLLAEDPQGVVGLYTFFVSTRYSGSTNDLQRTLQSLLPGRITFTGGTQAMLGDTPAARLDGRLRDPGGGAGQLRFECYIAQLATEEPRTVHLILFSSTDAFERNRADFDRVTRSVDLSG